MRPVRLTCLSCLDQLLLAGFGRHAALSLQLKNSILENRFYVRNLHHVQAFFREHDSGCRQLLQTQFYCVSRFYFWGSVRFKYILSVVKLQSILMSILILGDTLHI